MLLSFAIKFITFKPSLQVMEMHWAQNAVNKKQ